MHDDNGFEPDEQPASREEIVAAYVRRSKRKKNVAIRKAFVQQGGRGRLARPGPLAKLVRNSDHTALNAYVFARMLGSSDPWDVQLDSGVWVLALNLQDKTPTAAKGLVSKALRRLEDDKLITRSRAGRKSVVYPLHESGNGDPYTEISGEGDDPYLQLPLTYWTHDWHRKLTLPALAMLLIALDGKREFWLPAEDAAKWYGISASTANRGYGELEAHGLLASRYRKVRNDLSADGLDRRLMRRLIGDFAKPAKKPELEKVAAAEGDLPTVPHLRAV
ncbi:hypothetical protein SAMN05421837_113204 [Amycolatopsis pretoriensis]|uniref:Helix-turn-helix domain-containing protein n=1 Tax=Amycolatopsis pretoriensis TaxID=218821 RepID=A0A1H5RH47_9PSEU|nr:hypothetical protein [Amycolatopsis pretoriensis]SEF37374.1 hypothetical protein SAMN05421837_113204 [Amycolatopsis pretoriensis]